MNDASIWISVFALLVSFAALWQASRLAAGAHRIEVGKLEAQIALTLNAMKSQPAELTENWQSMMAALGQRKSGRMEMLLREFAEFDGQISTHRASLEGFPALGKLAFLGALESRVVDLNRLKLGVDELQGRIEGYQREHATLAAERRANFAAAGRANPGIARFRADDGSL